MGEIRLGPAGLPDAPSFEEAAGLEALGEPAPMPFLSDGRLEPLLKD